MLSLLKEKGGDPGLLSFSSTEGKGEIVPVNTSGREKDFRLKKRLNNTKEGGKISSKGTIREKGFD